MDRSRTLIADDHPLFQGGLCLLLGAGAMVRAREAGLGQAGTR